MAKRTVGKSKWTPEVRRRLVEVAREARGLVYGEAGCPEWGTTFAEIEDDAKEDIFRTEKSEVGHEFLRLLREQAVTAQTQRVPEAALHSDSGEQARLIGREPRTSALPTFAWAWHPTPLTLWQFEAT